MKMKKLIPIVATLLLTVALAACDNTDNNNGEGETNYFTHSFAARDISDYRYVEDEYHFYDVNMDDALALTQNPSFNGVLYFGFPGCPWCQSAMPVLVEASNATDVPVFYVSRANALREGDWLDWDADMAWWINEQFDLQWIYTQPSADYTDEEIENFVPEPLRPNIFVPFVVHIRDGIIVDAHRGTFEGHARMEGVEGRPTYPLTDDQHATLLERYISILNGVNATEDCNIFGLLDEDCS